MVMKLNIFAITILNLDSNHNFYPQVFLKQCKYFEKKVVSNIHDNLSDFSYSSASG